MFACIYAPGIEELQYAKLVDFASRSSPLLEQTSANSVSLDLRGSELLNGPFSTFHSRATALAEKNGLEVITAVAANPDAAFHAAHGLRKSVFIGPGKEGEFLRDLSLKFISPQLASISQERFNEMIDTLHTWGIYRFGQLAALPEPGISERLGPEGLRIRQLASGRSSRSLIIRRSDPVFFRSLELEHPIMLKEPLLFVLSQLLKELNEAMDRCNLAARGLEMQMKLADGSTYIRKAEFPTPLKDIKTIEKIVDLEITAFPPPAPIAEVKLWLEPGRFQSTQSGLFIPGGPEPEKTEMVLARIGKMVGPEKIGSPEVENSHRPDSFRMRHFHPGSATKEEAPADECNPGLTLRMLRPPLKASVWMDQDNPIRIHAPDAGIRSGISGKVVCASGPWKSSGEWWSSQKWVREEWDLQTNDGTVCRVYRDLLQDRWFVDGIYD